MQSDVSAAREFYLAGLHELDKVLAGEIHAKRATLMSMLLGWDLGLIGASGVGKSVLATALRDLCETYRESSQQLRPDRLLSSRLPEYWADWEHFEDQLVPLAPEGGTNAQLRGRSVSGWLAGVDVREAAGPEIMAKLRTCGTLLAEHDLLGVQDCPLITLDFLQYFSPEALEVLEDGLRGRRRRWLSDDETLEALERPTDGELRQLIVMSTLRDSKMQVASSPLTVDLGAHMGVATTFCVDPGGLDAPTASSPGTVQAVTSSQELDDIQARVSTTVVFPDGLGFPDSAAGAFSGAFKECAKVVAAFAGASEVAAHHLEFALEPIRTARQFRDLVRLHRDWRVGLVTS